MVEVNTDFLLQVIGSKVVELEALRIQLAQMQQAAQQPPVVQAPPAEPRQEITVDDVHAALLRKAKRSGQVGLA